MFHFGTISIIFSIIGIAKGLERYPSWLATIRLRDIDPEYKITGTIERPNAAS